MANLLRDKRMIARELLQRAAAQQVRSAVAHVHNAQLGAINPGRRQRRAHALLFPVLLRGREDLCVGKVRRAAQPFGLFAPRRLLLAVECYRRIVERFDAVLYDRFDR